MDYEQPDKYYILPSIFGVFFIISEVMPFIKRVDNGIIHFFFNETKRFLESNRRPLNEHTDVFTDI